MKLKCTDGEIREFESIAQYLCRVHGFDPVFLKHDGMVKIDTPDMGFIKQLKYTLKHKTPPPSYYLHYSHKHQKRCPASVKVRDLLCEVQWLAVLESFEHRKQSELSLKMDWLTIFSRLLFKSKKTELSEVVHPIYKQSVFRAGIGYCVADIDCAVTYIPEAASEVLALEEEGSPKFLVMESLLGFIDYVYIVPK